jgi:chromosomal replication initiation ATPase DnaA
MKPQSYTGNALADRLVKSVSAVTGIAVPVILGANKQPHVLEARRLLFFIARKAYSWSFPTIGDLYGYHAVYVGKSVASIGAKAAADERLKLIVDAVVASRSGQHMRLAQLVRNIEIISMTRVSEQLRMATP